MNIPKRNKEGVRIQEYNWDEQERLSKKGKLYTTYIEALTVCKQYHYHEVVIAIDGYTKAHIGYTVEPI